MNGIPRVFEACLCEASPVVGNIRCPLAHEFIDRREKRAAEAFSGSLLLNLLNKAVLRSKNATHDLEIILRNVFGILSKDIALTLYDILNKSNRHLKLSGATSGISGMQDLLESIAIQELHLPKRS